MRTTVFWAFAALSSIAYGAVSTTGRCGAANGGLTCGGSGFGECCSQYGWCGSSAAHCGGGCDSAHGTCTTPAGTEDKISTDGSCGGVNGYTCQGSTFGNCCSTYGFCGSSTAYCGTGCNPLFGTCTNSPSSSSRASSTIRSSSSSRASSSTIRSSSSSRASSSTIRSSSAQASSSTIRSTASSSSAVASPSASVIVSTTARCGNIMGATGGLSCLGSIFGDCCSQYVLGTTNGFTETNHEQVWLLWYNSCLLRNWMPGRIWKVHDYFIFLCSAIFVLLGSSFLVVCGRFLVVLCGFVVFICRACCIALVFLIFRNLF